MTLREEIEAINYTYMSKADEETLTGAYERLAGVLSEGMLLCAEDADGNLSLVTPEKEMPSGAEIC